MFKPIRPFYWIILTHSQIFFSFLNRLLYLQYKIARGREYGWGKKRPLLLEVVTAAIVLGLSFCLILDFENSENERKDDVGDKKAATLNESVVRIF